MALLPSPDGLRNLFERKPRPSAARDPAIFRGDDEHREYLVGIRITKIGDPDRAEAEIRQTLERELRLIFGDAARLAFVKRAARD